MNARQFFDLVTEMRKAQQGYFAIRKYNDPIAKKQALQYSIDLEAQVDREIERVWQVLKRQSMNQ